MFKLIKGRETVVFVPKTLTVVRVGREDIVCVDIDSLRSLYKFYLCRGFVVA